MRILQKFLAIGGACLFLTGCQSDPALNPMENKQAQQEFTKGGVDMNKVPPEQKAKVQEMIKQFGGSASKTPAASGTR